MLQAGGSRWYTQLWCQLLAEGTRGSCSQHQHCVLSVLQCRAARGKQAKESGRELPCGEREEQIRRDAAEFL